MESFLSIVLFFVTIIITLVPHNCTFTEIKQEAAEKDYFKNQAFYAQFQVENNNTAWIKWDNRTNQTDLLMALRIFHNNMLLSFQMTGIEPATIAPYNSTKYQSPNLSTYVSPYLIDLMSAKKPNDEKIYARPHAINRNRIYIFRQHTTVLPKNYLPNSSNVKPMIVYVAGMVDLLYKNF